MEAPEGEQVGILVIQAWHEHGSEEPFRARLSRSLDVRSGTKAVTVEKTPQSVLDTVEAWLEAFTAQLPLS